MQTAQRVVMNRFSLAVANFAYILDEYTDTLQGLSKTPACLKFSWCVGLHCCSGHFYQAAKTQHIKWQCAVNSKRRLPLARGLGGNFEWSSRARPQRGRRL